MAGGRARRARTAAGTATRSHKAPTNRAISAALIAHIYRDDQLVALVRALAYLPVALGLRSTVAARYVRFSAPILLTVAAVLLVA